MTRTHCAIIMALLGSAALGGCAVSSSPNVAGVPAGDGVDSALVLPSDELWVLGDPAGGWTWEYGRRDAELGLHGRAAPAMDRWVEIRTHDRRWTLNGRVRESSRTVTRTVTRSRP